MTWLGDRAYGIDLWHWPLLITYALVAFRDDVPVVVYRDLDHVTSSYAARLTPDVEERLRATLGR